MADGESATPTNRGDIVDGLLIEIGVIKEDIIDYIDEICFDSMDPEEVAGKLEDLRTKFRTMHHKLKHYEPQTFESEYQTDYEDIISRIKESIRQSRDIKSKQKAHGKMTIVNQEKAMMFQVQTTSRMIDELQREWDNPVQTATDDKLIAWRDNERSSTAKLDKVTEKYQELLKFPASTDELEKSIEDLGKKYITIISMVERFKKDLIQEINTRELNKRDLIKESKLNIKLSKFSGFDSELDVYTFQTEFEKLYLRTTTRRLLPDLLLNNHLSDPALSIVKNVDDISEIWARLKATYGDTKMLLSRKIACFDKQESLSKTKDPERIVSGLCQLTNLMRDLMSLASKHKIEMNLFYGDGLERIYKIMGDDRVTRWLEQSIELDVHNKTLWTKLIAFLEKEIRIQQQKTLLSGKEKGQAPRYKPNTSYLSNQTTNDEICHICGALSGESDHVSTNGPGGSKIIQYFSCCTFVEKTPAQRFSLIRKKGFCFQCLFPGAKWSQGKHNEGKCQQEFACPHPSHAKYPKRKHFLLCDEHKGSKENQDLLHSFKSRCIAKNQDLPTFSKELRLTFHSQTSFPSNISAKYTNDRGIYMFQSIKLNGELDTAGNLSRTFPKLPKHVGGKVDLMIGIKYLRYHPKPIFQSKSGLTIYKSVFRSTDGTTGVLGGPHESFSRTLTHPNPLFFINLIQNDKVPLLSQTTNRNLVTSETYHSAGLIKSFESAESTGSQVTYRCVTCRDCKMCKTHDSVEAISLKEEAEQALINSSVKINQETSITSARLPFISNPINRLAPNKSVALKVYGQQVKKLNNPDNSQDKIDVIQSEAKLQKLGYVDYVNNLPAHLQDSLKTHLIQNYIPWRAVWKLSSVSTPCRIVFDASMPTPSGYSLNDVLTKEKNGLNRLQEIMIRWCTHFVGIHTDISKMYNTIRLDEQDWCFQRYIWQQNLDPCKIPEEKVIKMLIYGVKPSGNQAEYGLRKVAELSSKEFPLASKIIKSDVYVDDCISGESSMKKAIERADELELIVNRGGFNLKGVSFSGQDPDNHLSDDGKSLVVGGLKWFPKDDMLFLNIGDLNFAKRQRGKKPTGKVNVIPEKLTKRDCVSKVGEIYDLLGRITPITASFKLDLRNLSSLKLDWDDYISEELQKTWLNNFGIMQDLKSLSFHRCIVPEDAESLDIETIDTADASCSLACSAIYARFKRKCGTFFCQLIFSRSKILPDKISQPRAELVAALLNVYTAEVVKRALGPLHKSDIKLSDSQVVLHWINNDDKPLKQWVRNRVIDIRRFTNPTDWYYVKSKDMIADLGTRKGCSIQDVSQHSVWINGFDWMSGSMDDFPMTSVKDLKLSNTELTSANQEIFPMQANYEGFLSNSKIVPNEVHGRFVFSNYLIDPNRFSFRKVVRILAYVLKFIRKCRYPNESHQRHDIEHLIRSKASSLNILLPRDIQDSENYYFKKCTDEVKHFVPKKKYEKFSKFKDGILVYTGRILSSDEVTITGKFTDAMKDLAASSFCVPVIDKHSPVAYAIVNDVHWNDSTVKHCGIETTLRSVLKKAYIIEARSLVKTIKKSCQRCRYLEKKTLQVIMGPIPPSSLSIAPAFYTTQCDAGPFKAYSPHNKRATIKIWLVVFCCCTTSSISIKVMDDYSTPSFIQAFIRFSSDSGFPKRVLCDEGSQLVKGCKAMKLSFRDAMNKLHQDVGIQFDTCPVGGHNFHGKVERKIREVNKSLEKSLSNDRLSLLQWETLVSKISNSINNLPIALKNEVSDFEAMDLLTPNRLRLGRNNERSPEGQMVTLAHPDKILQANESAFNSWFEVWLLCHVPKIFSQEKWFESDRQPRKGDIVLFLKQESGISNTDYHYGIIEEVEHSKDGIVRKATVAYKNHGEKTFRSTRRSVRSLILIRSIDESDIMTELGMMSCSENTASKQKPVQ